MPKHVHVRFRGDSKKNAHKSPEEEEKEELDLGNAHLPNEISTIITYESNLFKKCSETQMDFTNNSRA